MSATSNDWWVCYAQHKEPTYLEVKNTQSDQRARALEFATNKRHCIDVGSNVGFWTRELAGVFEHVHCFEPNEIFRQCFTKNVTESNVTLYPYALSGHEHTARQEFNSTVLLREDGNVQCRTLDSFYLKDVDFIKIDVDGFEDQVLQGSLRTLAACSPVINIEMKSEKRPDIVNRCVKILRGLGYMKRSRVKSDEIWLRSL